MSFISFDKVSKLYQMGDLQVAAIKDMSFSIEKGELVIIVGPSGAGKTTVLNLLGGMDTVTSGTIKVGNQRVSDMSSRELTLYRRNEVGFVFQFYNLIQNLTALENVELSSQICKNPLDAARALQDVHLQERLNSFPAQLSGGEQQRVAIARALAKNSDLLLCDEPTGALDYKTGKQILSLLQTSCTKFHKTVVIVTHNSAFTQIGNRVIHVKNGHAEKIELNDRPLNAQKVEW